MTSKEDFSISNKGILFKNKYLQEADPASFVVPENTAYFAYDKNVLYANADMAEGLTFVRDVDIPSLKFCSQIALNDIESGIQKLQYFFSLVILLILTLLPMSNIQAKRLAPDPVEPIHFEGIRYEVSGMGVVLAWDEKNNQELWKNTIYKVSYVPNLETDAQDIWITNLEVANGVLLVTNEGNATYKVDLKTGKVLSDPSDSNKIYLALVIGGLIFLISMGFVIHRFFIRQ